MWEMLTGDGRGKELTPGFSQSWEHDATQTPKSNLVEQSDEPETQPSEPTPSLIASLHEGRDWTSPAGRLRSARGLTPRMARGTHPRDLSLTRHV